MDREETGSFEVGGIEDFTSEMTSERSIITARGTGDGLVIRLDGRADRDSLRDAFVEFVNSRKRFLSGNDVTFEWVGSIPEGDLVDDLTAIAKDFDIEVKASAVKEAKSISLKDEVEVSRTRSGARAKEPAGLFGGIDSFPFEEELRASRGERAVPAAGVDSNAWDVADGRVIFSTIRSGQKIETEHSIIIFGDVNSGAELIAGGDIVVLGTLRGVAHAGAYDETGGGRVIFALNLQPTQLRIGAVISRGVTSEGSRSPEIARVDGTMIVVEPYQAKGALSRRRDM